MKKLVLCEFWEDDFAEKKERKESIERILELIAKQLNDISFILKDDEE